MPAASERQMPTAYRSPPVVHQQPYKDTSSNDTGPKDISSEDAKGTICTESSIPAGVSDSGSPSPYREGPFRQYGAPDHKGTVDCSGNNVIVHWGVQGAETKN
ncbi:hypothetical protein GMORB2_1582 [Geosmithia morbida]|uniref:Uncharacterized protein n=1 Tax=Geosmithia morbida TaxID=1094350 RepID=A0A9P5CZM2_9HYPO|nr:uncharacterized protein GMORB2_1582 [Geosmithia morbida]KAF4121743.1 hypothetical protein GMORB2_1582 [Geosmithia morbida]